MKHILIAVTLFFAVLQFGCKKASENLKLYVNTNVMESKVIITVLDAATGQAVPDGLKVKVRGEGVEKLFTFLGDKNFKYEDGKIILAIRSLNTTSPVSFSVSVYGTGYLPISGNISVSPGQTHYEASLSMINIAHPPADLEIKSYTMTVNSTGLVRQYTAHAKPTDDVYTDDQLTSVVFPAGCRFYYYKNTKGEFVPVLKSEFETANTYSEVRDIFELREDVSTTLLAKTSYTGTIKAYYIRSRTDVTASGTRLTVVENVAGINDPANPGNIPGQNIKTLLGETAPDGDIILHSVAQDPFAMLVLVGNIGGASGEDILLFPDPQAKWFASFVLYPNAINPATNQVLQEGDLIETSFDKDTTRKVKIKKATNGELRAESRSNNVGFFRKATFIKEYTHVVDGTPDNEVPDMENLLAKWGLNLSFEAGGMTYNRSLEIRTGPWMKKTLTIRLVSNNPAVENTFKQVSILKTYYAGDEVSHLSSNSQLQVMPFKTADWYPGSLKPEVTVDLTLICGNKKNKNKKSIRPTALYSHSDGYISLYMKNGVWKTKCLEQGEIVKFTVSVCNKSYDRSYPVSGSLITDVVEDDNICNCY